MNADYKDKIRAFMILKKLNREDVSKEIGICKTSFCLKLNGHNEFLISEAIKLAKILGCTIDDIFGEKEVAWNLNKKQ